MNSGLPCSCYFCTCSLMPSGGFVPRCMGQQRNSAISGLQYIHLVIILEYSDFFFLSFCGASSVCALSFSPFPCFTFVPNPRGSRLELTALLSLWFITSRCSCTLSKSEREEPHFASILADRWRRVHPVALILTEISARAVHDGNKYFIIWQSPARLLVCSWWIGSHAPGSLLRW